MLHAVTGGHPERLQAVHVIDAAERGDPVSVDIMAELAGYLGIAVANLVNLLNPERVILGGPVACSSRVFCDRVRDVVMKRAMTYPLSIVEVEQSAAGLDAGAIGAAVLVLRQASQLLFDSTRAKRLHLDV
jgi:predicted NBD/HSP70 family sugar kinase